MSEWWWTRCKRWPSCANKIATTKLLQSPAMMVTSWYFYFIFSVQWLGSISKEEREIFGMSPTTRSHHGVWLQNMHNLVAIYLPRFVWVGWLWPTTFLVTKMWLEGYVFSMVGWWVILVFHLLLIKFVFVSRLCCIEESMMKH